MNSIKQKRVIVLCSLSTLLFISINSCVESRQVTLKSSAQLWAENCQRCHNIPPASAFSAEQWKTIGLHMQSRALLTTREKDRIILFLQQ